MGNLIYMGRTISILPEKKFKEVKATPIHLIEQKVISSLEVYYVIKEEKK